MSNMNSANRIKVPRRILGSLLSSVSAGVVPRAGAPYIAIGRADEIAALLSDLEQIGGAAAPCAFSSGGTGAGKSFLIQLIRGYALERDFDRRCRSFPRAAAVRLRRFRRGDLPRIDEKPCLKASPDGGALPRIIARWIGQLQDDLTHEGVSLDSPAFAEQLNRKVADVMRELEFLVGGFDFPAL